MAFTEFYTNASTGSNMNGGSDENTSPSYTATNGGWNSGTGVYTPTSGDPSASVTVGQFAHVFADGATTPTFIGRVTAVNSTTVTVSTTAKSGTAPGTAGSGVSINVGGVWKGPNAAVGFPFGFVTSAQTNSSSDVVRVNFKNNATYSVTAGATQNQAGPLRFEGYTTTAGDGGRALFDGGGAGASYVILTASGDRVNYVNLIFANNGATGSATGVLFSGFEGLIVGVVAHDIRGHGIEITKYDSIAIECEAYACNASNSSGMSGIQTDTGAVCLRCISHDNTGSNGVGFGCNSNFQGACWVDCIADSNGGAGWRIVSNGPSVTLIRCDAYNNGGNGLTFTAAANAGLLYVENSNFIKNGGYGINASSSVGITGFIRNCGFGAGTQANTSGTTNGTGGVVVSGTVTYASDVTPWVDPANGDFRISLAAAKGAGRGAFTQTASSYSGTVGYPDIGAAQHQDSGATPYVIGS